MEWNSRSEEDSDRIESVSYMGSPGEREKDFMEYRKKTIFTKGKKERRAFYNQQKLSPRCQ